MHFRDREKWRKKMQKSVTCGAVSDCLEGKGRGYLDWKMSHESPPQWQNTTSSQYEFKEHWGEKVPVRDVPKKPVVWGEGAQRAQLCLGTDAKAGEGRDKGELLWLHPSAVFTADTNSSVNFPSVSFWFYPGRGCVFRAGGAVSRSS